MSDVDNLVGNLFIVGCELILSGDNGEFFMTGTGSKCSQPIVFGRKGITKGDVLQTITEIQSIMIDRQYSVCVVDHGTVVLFSLAGIKLPSNRILFDLPTTRDLSKFQFSHET